MQLPPKFELQKERSFSEKINGVFAYLSQNFKQLFKSLVFIVTPFAFAAGICSGIFQYRLTRLMPGLGGTGIDESGGTGNNIWDIFYTVFSPLYFVSMILMLVAYILVNCTVYSHMALYLKSEGEPVTFEAVFEKVKKDFFKVLLAAIASFFVALFGVVFFIIPGIYLFVTLTLIQPIMIVEGLGFNEAFNRCFYLIKEKWWSTFGLIFITSLIVNMCAVAFNIPTYIVQFINLMHWAPDISSFWQIIASVISIAGTTLLSAILSIAIGIQYFNLVERREGRGLRTFIDEIGSIDTKPESNQEL